MISRLTGEVVDRAGRVATLDVQGVGYEVSCSRSAADMLIMGETVSLVIFTAVREDDIKLYGFSSRLEREVFVLLTAVKGVGGKIALEIISRVPDRDLLRLIGQGDSGKLQAVKGIGKKTAERIVLELRDRVADFLSHRESVTAADQQGVGALASDAVKEAVAALCALGFSQRDAEQAVNEIPETSALESGEIVRQALQHI